MVEKVYRIKNTGGLFSSGGENPKFVKTGKIFTERGLRSHLGRYLRRTWDNPYSEPGVCVVVYRLVESSTKSLISFAPHDILL